MNLDDLVKYLTWIVLFILALTGLFFMLKKIGIL
jgi:hypothetical protein